jgi:uncharacterized tellurite resistance protein B-like protein
MIESIKNLWSQAFSEQAGNPAEREHGLNLIAAALMLEVARADFREDVIESERIFDLLKQEFALTAEDAEILMNQATEEVDEAVSLYEFTRVMNDKLSEQEKRRVLRLMWQVAFADQALHRYEDHLIRKVAELVYVPTVEMLRLRQDVEDETRARAVNQE